ncbi:MAG TPA: hypothetical protein VIU37_09570 [Candidatus Limnocylindrales bacterium]
MRLQAWDLDLLGTQPPDDAFAETITNGQRFHATMKFADALFDQPLEDQRTYFVHELLHLTHPGIEDPIRSGEWRQQIGQALYDHMWGEVKRGIEYMVDFVSRLVARGLPLPPWAEPPPAELGEDVRPL